MAIGGREAHVGRLETPRNGEREVVVHPAVHRDRDRLPEQRRQPVGELPAQRPPVHLGEERVELGCHLVGGDATEGVVQRLEESAELSLASESEADRVFAALGDGGKVQMPLAKTFFSPRFGMVADRFGVMWMVITEGAHA